MTSVSPNRNIPADVKQREWGTGILDIERVTTHQSRLKFPAVTLSGSCDKLLIGHLGDRMASGSRVLDLGSGTGANGLYFARNGCDVECVDLSEQALAICEDHAKDLGLVVKTQVADARNLELSPSTYDLVILSYLLQFVTAEEGAKIVRNSISALKPGGEIYISTFSTKEPLYQSLLSEYQAPEATVKKLDDRTFQLQNGRVLHFQTEEELLGNCPGLTLRYFFEGRELDLAHDDPHYHAFLTYIGQKPVS